VASQPQLLAQHCAEAGLNEKAVGYWLTAGQQAVVRSAMTEAVSQLQKGLDLLAKLPEGSQHQRQELDLQIGLARALLATQGYAAPAVAEAYGRARSLADQLDLAPNYLAPLLHGLWAFHRTRGELNQALTLAEEMEKLGKARDNLSALLLGKQEHGLVCFDRGELTAARALFEQCEGLKDPAHRAVLAPWVVQDRYVMVLAFLALTLAEQDYVKQGRARLNEALTEARQLQHALTLVLALHLAASFENSFGSVDQVLRSAEELGAISNEYGFPYWVASSEILQGRSLTTLGRPQEGLCLITKGLSKLRATGTQLAEPSGLIFQSEAYGALGRPIEALKCLDEAAQIIEKTQQRGGEAEVHRMTGEIALLDPKPDAAKAEAYFNRALDVARKQQAKYRELRAAMSMARLWRDQGKRDEARELLAPVYGWFTEGFDTLDLKEAKALLDRLA
jgi:predicted ATPase